MGHFLRAQFPVIHDVGGYVCRQNTANTANTSVHGLGRALDLMIRRLPDGSADPRGDEVAQWLIDHADEIGVQTIIWNRSIWSVGRTGTGSLRAYTGPSSHTDHIHMELNAAGAAKQTPWFSRPGSSSSVGESSIVPVVLASVVAASMVVAVYYGVKMVRQKRSRSFVDRPLELDVV